jgi:hypothetical protein
LGSNNTLTKLDLTSSHITIEAAAALASSLHSNATLRLLCLAGASLGGAESLRLILGTLGSNRGLTALDITEQMLDIPACAALGESLASGLRLEELDMACCHIGPKEAAVIADRLSRVTQTPACPLRLWNLVGNDLGAEGAAVLVEALAGTSCGDVLGQGLAEALEPPLSPLPTRPFPGLLSLNLGWNGIGDGGVAAMVQAGLGTIASLTELDLTFNKITGAGCFALAQHWAAVRFGVAAANGEEEASSLPDARRAETAAAAAAPPEAGRPLVAPSGISSSSLPHHPPVVRPGAGSAAGEGAGQRQSLLKPRRMVIKATAEAGYHGSPMRLAVERVVVRVNEAAAAAGRGASAGGAWRGRREQDAFEFEFR